MVLLTEEMSVTSSETAVALGVFDGIHRGHQAVINYAVAFKDEGLTPAVFTFNTDTVTSKGNGQFDMLISDTLKMRKLSELGVQYIYSPEFSRIKDLTAHQFVEKVLKDKLNASVVVCGENFHFGKGAFCGSHDLATICEEYGIRTVIVPFTMYNGQPVSSTEIRRLIKEGNIDVADYLLGYDFHFDGEVIHGNAIGKTLSFPTINQHFEKRQVVPRFGVYASMAEIEGKLYPSITNIGIKPTIGSESVPLAETYIIDYDNDLYGKSVTVYLKRFIRPERKFSGLPELKGQLSEDVRKAKDILFYNKEKGGNHNE